MLEVGDYTYLRICDNILTYRDYAKYFPQGFRVDLAGSLSNEGIWVPDFRDEPLLRLELVVRLGENFPAGGDPGGNIGAANREESDVHKAKDSYSNRSIKNPELIRGPRCTCS